MVSGTQFLPYLALYFSTFAFFYILLFKFIPNESTVHLLQKIIHKTRGFNDLKWLAIISLMAICVHLVILNRLPALDAWHAYRLSEVVQIRKSITEGQHPLINYMTSWNMKAVIPFTLALLMLRKEKWLYWLFFAFACGYAFVVMQKSFILLVLMPAGVISLFQRNWMYVIKYAFVGLSVVFLLTYIQNVSMRGGINDIRLDYEPQPVSTVTLFGKLFGGIQNRVIIIPGKTVAHWFQLIPKEKPYLYGQGFKMVAKLTGKPYHNYAKELYPYVYPENAKHGIIGSVNVASLMRGYSNFGTFGLILSALLLALVLHFISGIFKGPIVYSLAFNAFPILMLSSGSLLTILFSGGWLITIFLFLAYRNQISQFS